MSDHVKKMECELNDLKKYVDERPGMLNRLESLLNLQKQSTSTISDLQSEITDLRKQCEWDKSDLSEFRKKNTELKRNLEDTLSILSKTRQEFNTGKHVLKTQLVSLQHSLSQTRNQALKNQDIKELQSKFYSELQNTTTFLQSECNQILSQKIRNAQIQKDIFYTAKLEMCQKQIVELESNVLTLNQSLESHVSEIKELKSEKFAFQNGYRLLLEQAQSKNSDLTNEILNLKNEIQSKQSEYEQLQASKKEVTEMMQKIDSEKESVLNECKLKIQEKEKSVLTMKQEMENERKAFEASQALANQAGVGLAKKDSIILNLEKNIKELKKETDELKKDREQTIDAHQSRIKQLQDNFLVQLKEAGKLETEKASNQLKRIMQAEKDAAIKEWTQQLQEEFTIKEKNFVEQLFQANNAHDATKKEWVQKASQWEIKFNLLQEQNKKISTSNAIDFEHYQARIRKLEQELVIAKKSVAPAQPVIVDLSSTEKASIQEMKSLLAKRNAEIVFLKNTVRLECEERIQLVAKLSGMSNNGQVNDMSSNAPAAEMVKLRSLEGNFEQMMKDANMKKEKKLAKSSSKNKLLRLY